MANLKDTIVLGKLNVTDQVTADKLIKLGGSSSQFLLANGDVTGIKTINGSSILGSGNIEAGGVGWPGTGSYAEKFNYESNKASGAGSHAEGRLTTASGWYSHAEGYYTTASGEKSHAEGSGGNTAYNYTFTRTSTQYQYTCDSSLPFGEVLTDRETYAKVTAVSGTGSPYTHTFDKDFVTTAGETVILYHAFGVAYGKYSHAEGCDTTASGMASHAEGYDAKAFGSYSHAEGTSTASGESSHAEGDSTKALGNNSHAEGTRAQASGYTSHAEGYSTKASGESSHAEGNYTIASGKYSHAEGNDTTASGESSHAEGDSTTASGSSSHAEGEGTTALGKYGSHAEGSATIAFGDSSHAEGCGFTLSTKYTFTRTSTQYQYTSTSILKSGAVLTDKNGTYAKITAVSGTGNPYTYTLNTDFVTTVGGTASLYTVVGVAYDDYSHSEGYQTTASGASSHAEGYSTKASGNNSHAEGYQTTASGNNSHVEGYNTTASGDYSHAEGSMATASGSYSHAEGSGQAEGSYSHAEGSSIARGSVSHSEGSGTTASGMYSHSEGRDTVAGGQYSHAEGYDTTASGTASHAGGYGTIANNYQYVVGKYNTSTTAPSSLSDTTTSAGLFIVGIGRSDSKRSNGFRVNPAGNVYGVGSFNTSGADYAEYFEWLDGNPNNEDRRGRFVTLDEDKIRYATIDDDYILGVISAEPSVVGDVHSEEWHDRYLKDIYGNKIVEVVEVEETTDENGEIIPAHTERRWVLNPNYDSNANYTSREERPEWAAVGLMGKLVVVDDGTCQINGYCYPKNDGIATFSKEKTNYRVMKRLDDTHIKVLIK